MKRKKRLNPANDYLFCRLFGEEESKPLLIGLLNALLSRTGTAAIAELKLMNGKLLTKRLLKDKGSVLDIRCETGREQINVEMQLGPYRHMDKRSLFYVSRLLAGSIRAGEDYASLKKTIGINLLDYALFPLESYRHIFQLCKEGEERFRLTDLLELHFVEFPKFRAAPFAADDPLHRWLRFLDRRASHQQIKELTAMDETIKMAEDRLAYLSEDDTTRMLYEAREKAERDRISFLKDAWERGIEEGEQKGRQEGIQTVAKNLLREGADPQTVSKVTGLSLPAVLELKRDTAP